jgi:tetratricopeptide (TPR) repeat protein
MFSFTRYVTTVLLLLGFFSDCILSGEPVFDLSLDERILLEKQEPGLRNAVEQAVEEFGDSSQEKANALHKLGRVLYKLEKYAGLRSAAKEIARIEEALHGHDSTKLALALRNVGSVAFRLELHEESLRYMMRALNILLHHYEADSKEVTMHKSIMMTFDQQEEYIKTPLGMTHKQFKKVEQSQKNFEFVLDEL